MINSRSSFLQICSDASWKIQYESSTYLVNFTPIFLFQIHHTSFIKKAISWIYFRSRYSSFQPEINEISHRIMKYQNRYSPFECSVLNTTNQAGTTFSIPQTRLQNLCDDKLLSTQPRLEWQQVNETRDEMKTLVS